MIGISVMKTKIVRISPEAYAILAKKRKGFERSMDVLDRILKVKRKAPKK